MNFIKMKILNRLFYFIIAIYTYYHYSLINIYSTIDKFYFLFLLTCLIVLFFFIFLNFNRFLFVRNLISIVMITIISVEIFFSLSLKSIQFIPLKPIPNPIFGKKQVLDYLEVNPWIKFKPNTLITSDLHKRGGDFVHSWKTDKYGYKNKNNFDQNSSFYALAIGDSFTEGMGVETSDTWPAILTKILNKKIYNGGVQGYAPIQFKGSLDFLKNKISFETVIIGHLVGISDRNKSFKKKKITKGTGGIEWIRANKGSVMVIQITKIFFDKIKQLYNKNEKFTEITNYQTILADEKLKKKYSNEKKFNIQKNLDLKNDKDFQVTLETYLQIADWCKKNKKKLFIVLLLARSDVYFPDYETSNYDLEKDLLVSRLNNFDFTIISTKEALIQYTKKYPDKLPYLSVDGHLSSYGNIVVAEKISEFIK